MLNHDQSEVARLRQQIDEECAAMQRAMTGFARTASHNIINQRFESIEAVQQQLAKLVGEEEAAAVMVEIYTKAMG